MFASRIRHVLVICAIGAIPFLRMASAEAASPDDAVSRCDALASDPHDPGRYSAGVTDAQFAPGAAIEACRAAVDAAPNIPRLWFQLGRAYWLADRDADAFAAFVQAVQRGYAPAMKSIGDAYVEGRGLPAGEMQNMQTGLAWYRKAKQAGFRDADRAIQEATAMIASSTFNPSLFQNPAYMTMMYSGNYEAVDNPIAFFYYTDAFAEELGGTNIFFMDQDCTGMVTVLGTAINKLGQLAGYVQTLQGDNVFVGLFSSIIAGSITQDQGKRDAVTLMHKYKCDNPITRRIVDNVIGSYQKIPTILNAFKNRNGGGTPGYSSTRAGVPLFRERIDPLYWGVIAGKCVARPVAGCGRIQQLISSQAYDVIQCNYGPISNGTGYQNYAFWHSKVPDDPLGYAIQGDDHPFLMLGKLPVAKCPPTAGEAEPIFQASRLSQR